jgi:hypothetical protein
MRGSARQAGLGVARHRSARPGVALQGKARQAGLGEAGQGEVWQGKARLAMSDRYRCVWSQAEDAALTALATDPNRWSAQQIGSLLARQGFRLRSRAAVLGRLHRLKIPIRPRLPASEAAQIISRRKNSMVRRAFLAKMGGEEPARHPSDRVKRPHYGVKDIPPHDFKKPDVRITGKHASPDAEALALPLEALDSKMCHFPYGIKAPFQFCGLPTDGRQYCEKHLKLTHNQHR